MPKDQRYVTVRCDDLNRVLDHIWIKEEQDYLMKDKPRSHIFTTMRKLNVAVLAQWKRSKK